MSSKNPFSHQDVEINRQSQGLLSETYNLIIDPQVLSQCLALTQIPNFLELGRGLVSLIEYLFNRHDMALGLSPAT